MEFNHVYKDTNTTDCVSNSVSCNFLPSIASILTLGLLQTQKQNCMTDDGCIHFKNRLTGQIYSWNTIHNKWQTNNSKDNSYLSKNLFD